MSTEVVQKKPEEKGLTTYTVGGQEVKLSFDIVRNYLVKGNADVTDSELVQFIGVCKFNLLNPFLNEAYLIKFRSAHGDGSAQMIVSKEAFFKRAEANPMYDGIDAGIIVDRNGDVIELDGCFKLSTDVLLGGWAKVYRKDRSRPVTAKVNLGEYDKGSSIWREKKSTMICKIAKVQALRESFPSQLGAMYTPEEQNIQDVNCTDVTKDRNTADSIVEIVKNNRSRVEDAMAKNDMAEVKPYEDRHSVYMHTIDEPITNNEQSTTLFNEEQ